MSPALVPLAVLAGALALDLVFGDPPNRWHPVAWLGTLIAMARRRLAHGSSGWLLVSGALVTLALVVLAACVGVLVVRAAAHLGAAGLAVRVVNKVSEGGPHVVDALRRGDVALVVNTPAGADSQRDAFQIRRAALECRVPYFTTLAAAAAAAEGIDLMRRGPFTVRPLQEHHRRA